ncbi:MAG: hypothetical protein COV07_02275 [Candidatus Vogelbacteria bacterium CG10_big_fil_rev_8_21_14_0_10_45_14]|uniref:Uncharacterized protein n=1 Tax=Candidatus Vogelbacteria bacterium CG10_big_fil_rev_8_21_14_0_10_45_14 TaxID=1975042 RepID=A0A2H0RL96_9BACT|nr:MAG: hypothetical protein COV07_02275 [Candidatus Vogelbacteria bacterium CG10_big_fil_rev_8_21_14_0_10_45_14]
MTPISKIGNIARALCPSVALAKVVSACDIICFGNRCVFGTIETQTTKKQNPVDSLMLGFGE